MCCRVGPSKIAFTKSHTQQKNSNIHNFMFLYGDEGKRMLFNILNFLSLHLIIYFLMQFKCSSFTFLLKYFSYMYIIWRDRERPPSSPNKKERKKIINKKEVEKRNTLKDNKASLCTLQQELAVRLLLATSFGHNLWSTVRLSIYIRALRFLYLLKPSIAFLLFRHWYPISWIFTHNEIMRTSMLDKEISPLNFIGVFELQKKIAYNPTLKSTTPP